MSLYHVFANWEIKLLSLYVSADFCAIIDNNKVPREKPYLVYFHDNISSVFAILIVHEVQTTVFDNSKRVHKVLNILLYLFR